MLPPISFRQLVLVSNRPSPSPWQILWAFLVNVSATVALNIAGFIANRDNERETSVGESVTAFCSFYTIYSSIRVFTNCLLYTSPSPRD